MKTRKNRTNSTDGVIGTLPPTFTTGYQRDLEQARQIIEERKRAAAEEESLDGFPDPTAEETAAA